MNKFIPAVVVIACLAVIGGWFAKAAPERAEADRKPLYWYDPMQPEQHFNQPGKSPFMDMELVTK